MPKMKSHRGAAKRFSKTKSGKIKFKHANLRHNLSKWSNTTKKNLMKTGYLAPSDEKRISRLTEG